MLDRVRFTILHASSDIVFEGHKQLFVRNVAQQDYKV
jgi:dTDP-4-dehydrorhamnose reductase